MWPVTVQQQQEEVKEKETTAFLIQPFKTFHSLPFYLTKPVQVPLRLYFLEIPYCLFKMVKKHLYYL